ncbi:hypothetical protein Tco_0325577, partial [Tanacetum coccineum]
ESEDLFFNTIKESQKVKAKQFVASVLIGGGVTSEEGLGDEKSVTGAITGGVDMTV